MIERWVVTPRDPFIYANRLPTALQVSRVEDQGVGLDMRAQAARFERKLVHEAVERFGSTKVTARHLKINQPTVVRRLKGARRTSALTTEHETRY